MLTLSNVHYDYNKAPFLFDLNVKQGEILALMGPSGAGKSTLLALVAGFIEPSQGSIVADGMSVLGKEPHARPFAMLFQEHNLFAHLTVRENIGLGLHPGLKLSKSQVVQVEQAAEQVGVATMLDRLPEQLSGGQKQRVALARCFIQPHSIWLLDEPFSALDPILREEMLSLVKALATQRNITVIMVTHHLSDAKAIATNFAFVSDGKVAVAADISELSSEHPNQQLGKFVMAGEQK
ncbi:thiamine ABC transporter ATP-binding protein [Vibrio sp. S4M6]|uniref:thiamine ABC transporter ATP-binding protein n=1 Tax=Vibrio sinus TaxID=2946865 RepID=UPI00202AAC15|nr:thiamine ABC transporter ATP-binding protein [Vibrio sinus]MCL9780507.1 thiamine ABC transporter ATP-binding protein [Vibrio sinus]